MSALTRALDAFNARASEYENAVVCGLGYAALAFMLYAFAFMQ